MRWATLAGLLLVGCASVEAAYLKHPQTGQVVQCGPYTYVILRAFDGPALAARQRQCIEDYKEQRFVRVPSP